MLEEDWFEAAAVLEGTGKVDEWEDPQNSSAIAFVVAEEKSRNEGHFKEGADEWNTLAGQYLIEASVALVVDHDA